MLLMFLSAVLSFFVWRGSSSGALHDLALYGYWRRLSGAAEVVLLC